ncbi:DUF805 domain-containing protein [Thaumasiovibrio sp. DFM-14]|uniref:DUF805 domain-containing protein n=1 Tax=Thaumasiovibrio sp. DFM-14 TaxID=3384792 RepID=UPI0039A1758A
MINSQKWALLSTQGRMPRKAYWIYSIPVMLVFMPTFFYLQQPGGSLIGDGLSFVVMLFVWWASIALNIKRLHDRNKSGLWVLLTFVPVIGPVFVFVELGCLKGTVGPNRFGSDPLGGTSPASKPPKSPSDDDSYTMEG